MAPGSKNGKNITRRSPKVFICNGASDSSKYYLPGGPMSFDLAARSVASICRTHEEKLAHSPSVSPRRRCCDASVVWRHCVIIWTAIFRKHWPLRSLSWRSLLLKCLQELAKTL